MRDTYRVPTYSRVRSTDQQMHWGCLGLFVAALVLLVLMVVGFWRMEYGSQQTVTFKITGLDDQAQGNGHKYLVFATQDGRPVTYEDTDAWFHGKTDSTDVWVRFRVGQTWTCPIYGYRVHVLSSYPDILDGCHQAS